MTNWKHLFGMLVLCLSILGGVMWASTTLQPIHCPVGDESDLGCARGFEGRESDPRGSFRWSDQQAQVLLWGSGYASHTRLILRLAAPRPTASPAQMDLRVGNYAVQLQPTADLRRYQILLPGLYVAERATIDLNSDTFRTANGRRVLGLQVYGVSLDPLQTWRFPSLLLSAVLLITSLAAGYLISQRRWFQLVMAAVWFAILLAGWMWHPIRVIPYLPALAATLIGLAIISRRMGGIELLRQPVVVVALGLNTLFDALIVAQLLPRSTIVVALASQLLISLICLVWLKPVRHQLAELLVITTVVRLLGFAVRLLAAQAASDNDTQLFYSYGQATLALGMPEVEYPSGALIPWLILAASGSAERFTLLLPLFNLGCDLVIVWGIWQIAQQFQSNQQVGFQLPLWYAISPLLLPFWHSKYDSLPTALLIAGLALLLRAPGWAGILLGLGGSVKWVPWLALPFTGWYTLRSLQPAKPRPWIRITLGALAAISITAIPFALINLEAFLTPYRMQGARPIIGESIWFPLAVWLKPELLQPNFSPWTGVRNSPLSRELVVLIQLGVLTGLGVIQLVRPVDLRRTIILAALTPALFLLLNRVFSPQYLLLISACWLVALACLQLRQPLLLVGIIGLTQACNVLIWPNTMPYWLMMSIIMFSVALGLSGWLIWQSWQMQPSSGTIQTTRTTLSDS